MLKALAKFFEERVDRPAHHGSGAEREHALRLATAVLLFEIVRADGTVSADELAVMRTAIRSTFELQDGELDELVRLAGDASREATSLYEFTQRVDQAFDADEKKRVVELLWLVAFADGRKDALEEHLVRKIAGLIHVSHPDFIDAKLRAKAARPARPGA